MYIPELTELDLYKQADAQKSHYIGDILQEPPYLDDTYMKFDYISNIDHSALRYPLKFWADQYKTGSATVTEESLTLQYRKFPGYHA